ncbi:TIGR02678 family protein [Pseudonocardia ammonioxydans]|uniref:TIGR02678 family protein n=1 Tax=Pseudonocardia ammonioxydans TaxID=260086 RepID=A0A1I4UHW1_PSUAM|nr:TIGR02678 family protein [Pseudonocardia ammonioxydans]SFM88293.1 TIGR02678 family protein [Pseudonocardia ammonioxydans]
MSRVERPAPAEDVQAVAERRRAARALLRHPLLHADGPGADDLRLVRRHRAELERLFADGLGYRLIVEPTAARLMKSGLGRDAGRPLLRRSGRPFGPRGYALLCLTVAALGRSRTQLLVDELVAQVRSAAVDAGIDVDLDAIADRRALYAALSALVDLGVLHERDGDLEHWAEQRTASLLDVRRDRLPLLVSAALGGLEQPGDLLDVAALPSASGGARVAVRRRLVESPVLATADLPEEQAEWWRRNRNRERVWFADRFGLELEIRAEGAIAVDPAGELSDVEFPGGGSARQFALLLLEQLADASRPAAREREAADRTWMRVGRDVVVETAEAVRGRWGRGLKREHREDPAAALADATAVLADSGLIRIEPDGGWSIHAAAARYTVQASITESGGTGPERTEPRNQQSLFGQEDG